MVVPLIDPSLPDFGLALDANGHPVQNTGCGEAPISARTSLILTTDPVYYPGSADAYDISKVSRFSIWLGFTIGSLTNMILRTFFIQTKASAVEFYMPMPIFTAGSRVLDVGKTGHLETEYTLTATAQIIIPIINPGAQFMRFSVEGTGNVTGSLLTIDYTRSFLNHHVGEGIPAA